MSNPQEAQSIQVNAERPHPAAAETTLIPRSLAALADPTRATVLDRLIGGPLSVGQIAQGLPVSRPAVSQHLKVLGNPPHRPDQRGGIREIAGLAESVSESERTRRRLRGQLTSRSGSLTNPHGGQGNTC